MSRSSQNRGQAQNAILDLFLSGLHSRDADGLSHVEDATDIDEISLMGPPPPVRSRLLATWRRENSVVSEARATDRERSLIPVLTLTPSVEAEHIIFGAPPRPFKCGGCEKRYRVLAGLEYVSVTLFATPSTY